MSEPVHEWFCLTYANTLVLHRSLLQSMPVEWQERFVACLNELRDAFGHLDQAESYQVTPRDSRGRFIRDTIPHYDRGRTRVKPALRAAEEPSAMRSETEPSESPRPR